MKRFFSTLRPLNLSALPAFDWYRITSKKEQQIGYQYREEGFYFTDIKNIFQFLNNGIYLREIILPVDNWPLRIYQDEKVFYANRIILGRRWDLNEVSTFQYLLEEGADFQSNDLLSWTRYAPVEVAQFISTLRVT